MADGSADPRRRVPRADAVLAGPPLVATATTFGCAWVKAAVATAQERARRGEIPPEEVGYVAAAILPSHAGGLQLVINATGVVLHTNLGRAPLSAAAVEAVTAAAGNTDVGGGAPGVELPSQLAVTRADLADSREPRSGRIRGDG